MTGGETIVVVSQQIRNDESRRRDGGRLGGDIDRYLSDVSEQLEPYLEDAIARVPGIPILREGVVYQINGGGKRLRAALCATVCEIFCGSFEPALSFAAAIEHLQNFTLIHDDIADGDGERRGKLAAWQRFGLAQGINIGDIFVPLAALAVLEGRYTAEVKIRLLQTISEHGLMVAEGQSRDISLRHNNAPTFEDYFECAKKKTGAFFGMAVVGGGIVGGADQVQLELLREFALAAGVAFQIKDDLLDVVGGKGRTAGSDVVEGKRTLLMIYAAERASDQDRLRLIDIHNFPPKATTVSEITWVHELYRRTGTLQRAEEAAEALLEDVITLLERLPRTRAKYRFIRLSRYLTRRIH